MCAMFEAFDWRIEGEVSTDGSQVRIVKAQTRHLIFTFEANRIFEWPSARSLGQVRDNMNNMDRNNLTVGLCAGCRQSHRVAGWSQYARHLGGREWPGGDWSRDCTRAPHLGAGWGAKQEATDDWRNKMECSVHNYISTQTAALPNPADPPVLFRHCQGVCIHKTNRLRPRSPLRPSECGL
jgi:hypothetical protein